MATTGSVGNTKAIVGSCSVDIEISTSTVAATEEIGIILGIKANYTLYLEHIAVFATEHYIVG